MASVASSGTSPLPVLEQPFQGDFVGGDDESWAFITQQGNSNPSSVGFFSSPDTGSLRSFGIVGRRSQVQPSPPAPSPLFLDPDHQQHQQHQQFALPILSDQGSYVDQQQQGAASSFGDHNSFVDQAESFPDHASFMDQVTFEQVTGFTPTPGASRQQQFTSTAGSAGAMFQGRLFTPNDFGLDESDIPDFTNPFMNTFSTISPHAAPSTGLESPICMNPSPQPIDIPAALQSDVNVTPWNPSAMKRDDSLIFIDDFLTASAAQGPVTPTSTSSPAHSASPISPVVKQELGVQQRASSLSSSSSAAAATTAGSAIRKVRGGARIEKRKSPSESSGSVGSLSSSAGSNTEVALKFITISSEAAAAQAGKPNMFDCFERMTQRGRKGPLADATKENALQVRRVGACFCCHARKVKCDAQRPCKNCKKLTMQVPGIVCWQFQDFLGILFPDLLRGHFAKDQMAQFISENVKEFLVDGAERPCTVELTSGSRLTSTLVIPAKAFTAKQPDILHHWRQDLDPGGNVNLNYGVAAPIGLDVDGGGAQREDLRKRAREYTSSIVREPCFADELTASIRSTTLVREVLRIVQTYALRSQSEIVKKALNIYTCHYVLTRHLTITANGLSRLMRQRLVSQNQAVQTPRLLNRQFKAVLDEITQREMQLIYESFSKCLKPKMRKDWAPCMAAFLVLAMYMEEIEVALDVFGVSQNEINRQRGRPLQFERRKILAMNREIENMPFRQFAYQFHQIYQTHSTDASTKPFNPLMDDSLLNEQNLDLPAIEMVRSLRFLMEDMGTAGELDFLSGQGAGNDNIDLDNGEANHPFPMDLSCIYSGRLMAKFILSFTSIQHILDP